MWKTYYNRRENYPRSHMYVYIYYTYTIPAFRATGAQHMLTLDPCLFSNLQSSLEICLAPELWNGRVRILEDNQSS